MARKHVVLLGDSIFDNGGYVQGGPDVAAQLRAALGDDAKVTLLAVDGSVTSDIPGQIAKLPADATHLVVSAGGNDILHHVAALDRPVALLGDALVVLAEMTRPFAAAHGMMVAAVAALGLPTAICTIYDANFAPPQGRMVTAALGLFNDAISRNIHAAGLDVVDLRLVCSDRDDYANPIEPSVRGGLKIAGVLARYVRETDARGAVSRVFV